MASGHRTPPAHRNEQKASPTMQLAPSSSPLSDLKGRVDHACFSEDWDGIRRPEYPLIVQRRSVPALELAARPLLAFEPFMWRSRGTPDSATAGLGDLPSALADDVVLLAARFARLMGCEEIELRLKLIDNDSCCKLHADYTDVRLLTTYGGRGTQFASGDPSDGEATWEIAAGDIALLKGWNFEEGHDPCFHRSPPIAGTGQRRLLLAIDTARIGPQASL